MVGVGGGQVDREEGGETAGQHHPQGEGGVETGGHPCRVIRAGHTARTAHQQILLQAHRLTISGNVVVSKLLL